MLSVIGSICVGYAMYEKQLILAVKVNAFAEISTIDDVRALFPTSSAQIAERLKSYKTNCQHDVQKIVDIPHDQRTFDNTALALDRITSFCDLTVLASICEVLESLSPDESIRQAAHKAVIEVQHFYVDAIESNKQVFNAFREYVEGNALVESLSDEQRYFLKEMMDTFIKSGLNLPDDQLVSVKKLKKELAELSIAFERNIAQDNRTLEVTIDELDGVDRAFIATLAKTNKGNYLLGTDYPTRAEILENCNNADTRRRYFKLFFTRAYPANNEVLSQIIAKRDQLARLLGFASYAHLDTADQMVQSPERAYNFLYDLIGRVSNKEKIEFHKWLADAPESVKLDDQGRIQPWDILYAQTAYKKNHLAVNEAEIAEHFPMENTIKGLLDIYRSFLSIDFKEVPIGGLWHEDVTLIEARDKDDAVIGYLFMDLYPRPNKYGHAAHATMIPSVTRYDDARGEYVRIAPMVSVIIANFPKSTPDKPSLLRRDDVNTFFHEFGHALHALCGATHMASFAGTSVKRDFVEMPSQMLEEWLWDKDVLRSVSCHYQNGQPLSDTLIDSIIALRAYNAGYWVKRQAFFSLIALDYHGAGESKNMSEIWRDLHKKLCPHVALSADTHEYASFGHLTGYGAKYYGYLWSRIYAGDIYGTIKSFGLANPLIGQRYTQQVIGKGGSCDPEKLLCDFLGRSPQSDAFMKNMGLE